MPDLVARRAVEGEDTVERSRVVDDPIDRYRCRLQTLRDIAGLMRPRDMKMFDVVLVDLIKRTVALRVVGAMVARPVAGLGVLDGGDTLRRGRGSAQSGGDDTTAKKCSESKRSCRVAKGRCPSKRHF